MNREEIKARIITNVYHIEAGKTVNLHAHPAHDELFYCMKGSGHGVLQQGEVELTTGRDFIVPAGTLHALRTDGDLWVASFLIPVIGEEGQSGPDASQLAS